MKNNFLLIKNKKNIFIKNFLINLGLDSIDLQNSINTESPTWIFVQRDTKYEDIEKIISDFDKKESTFIFFLPSLLQSKKFFSTNKIFYYPMNINKFENLIRSNNYLNRHKFLDITIEQNNLVINNQNNLNIYFTDTEILLILKLIKKRKIKKSIIKSNILNFNSLSDTRSLESHLSRIRRKLITIDSKISIISEDAQYIKIS